LHQRVKQRFGAWKRAGATNEAQQWIKTGVGVTFKAEPPPPFHHGPSLEDRTPDQTEFWKEECGRLISCGAWELGGTSDFVSKAFLVPKLGTNKWRLVVDLRHLNEYCIERSVKFETLKALRRLAKVHDWMFSFDLEDGYYAVQIKPEDRKYMCVEVDGQIYQFCGLPMGWSLSPYYFVKFMKTFVGLMRAPDAPTTEEVRKGNKTINRKKIRRGGLRVLPYMDDFLVLTKSYKEALRARKRVQQILDFLGLKRNPKKAVWDPTQRLVHLGLEIDTVNGLFRVPEKRLLKIKALGKQIIQDAKRSARLIPARTLAKFVGLSQSVYLAVAPARFYLRELHNVIATKKTWGSRVRLTKQALRDLAWWIKIPAKWNGREIWRSPDTGLMHSDASLTGWGAVLNKTLQARGFWTAQERQLHITHLELLAVYKAVRSFLPWIRNRKLLLREDNMGVVHMLVNYTSRNEPLMKLLRLLWFLLDVNNIELHAKYIRSAANWWADALSRELDLDDWRLNPKVFQEMQLKWGWHTFDRFASDISAQLPRYNSKDLDPTTSGTNSLALDWRGERNWVNPPWALLEEVAQKREESGCEATVVAPYWTRTSWFSKLWNLSSEVVIKPPSHDLFLPTRLGAEKGVGPAKWSAIFFRIPARTVTPASTSSIPSRSCSSVCQAGGRRLTSIL
jgi:hypothetical protein